MKAAAGPSLKNVTAVVSMLHEAADPSPNSGTRRFRGAPVLQWTLDRIQRARRIDSVAVLCWEDQLSSVVPVAGEERAYVLAKGPRVPLPDVEAAAVARRWSDGWRGGLLSTCSFDLGFHGRLGPAHRPWAVLHALARFPATRPRACAWPMAFFASQRAGVHGVNRP